MAKISRITQVMRHTDEDTQLVESVLYNNEIYVTYKFLSMYYGVQIDAVRKWVSINGMEKSEDIGTHQVPVFNLKYVINWHRMNIGISSRAKNTKSTSGEASVDMDYLEGFEALSEMDKEAFIRSNKDSMDKVKTMADIMISRIKIDKERGKLVERADVNIVISEYVGIFMSQLKMDLKIFPVELQHKTPKQISDFIEPHFRSTLDTLKSVFVEKSKDDTRVYELFETMGGLIRERSIKEINEELQKLLKRKL